MTRSSSFLPKLSEATATPKSIVTRRPPLLVRQAAVNTLHHLSPQTIQWLHNGALLMVTSHFALQRTPLNKSYILDLPNLTWSNSSFASHDRAEEQPSLMQGSSCVESEAFDFRLCACSSNVPMRRCLCSLLSPQPPFTDQGRFACLLQPLSHFSRQQ